MLIVVRHGRTESNARGLLLGRSDPSLDPTGTTQAEALAQSIGPVDRVISSPLRRCRQTASAFECPAEIDARWVELDYGDYDGLPTGDVPASVWQRWRSDLDFAPPNGESLAAMAHRVRAALDAVAPSASDDRVVVVTHVSPIKVALAWALGVGDEISWRSYVAPAAVMRIAVTQRGPVLQSFNDIGHLSQSFE